jgi:hypothetical protein
VEIDEAIDRTEGDPVFLGDLMRRAPSFETAPDVTQSCVVHVQ